MSSQPVATQTSSTEEICEPLPLIPELVVADAEWFERAANNGSAKATVLPNLLNVGVVLREGSGILG